MSVYSNRVCSLTHSSLKQPKSFYKLIHALQSFQLLSSHVSMTQFEQLLVNSRTFTGEKQLLLNMAKGKIGSVVHLITYSSLNDLLCDWSHGAVSLYG